VNEMMATSVRTLPASAPQQCSCTQSPPSGHFLQQQKKNKQTNKTPAVSQQPYSPAVSPAEIFVFLKLEVSLK
jgi:hypothetical protein